MDISMTMNMRTERHSIPISMSINTLMRINMNMPTRMIMAAQAMSMIISTQAGTGLMSTLMLGMSRRSIRTNIETGA